MFRARWIPVFRFYSQLWPVIDEVNFSNRRIKWLYDFPKLVFPIQNIDWRCALSMRSRPHNAVLLFNNPQMLIAYKAKLALYFVFITIYYMSVAAFSYSTWLLTLGPFLKKKNRHLAHVMWVTDGIKRNKAAETYNLALVYTYSIHSHSNDQCKSMDGKCLLFLQEKKIARKRYSNGLNRHKMT